MPELPEVETVRRGLTPVLEGARLSRVRINRPDLRFPFPDQFVERLDGATVLRIDRRAKYLLMPLSTGETWITHLGMTGRFTLDGALLGEFEEAAPIAGKHEHFSGCAIRDASATRIGYADARRFGFMGLVATDQIEAHPWFAGLGRSPWATAFPAPTWSRPSPARNRTSRSVCWISGSSQASAISMCAKRCIARASRLWSRLDRCRRRGWSVWRAKSEMC